MIGKIADAITKENINIADMTNKSRDDIAINLIDIDQDPSDDLIKKLSTIDHVLSVRNCTQITTIYSLFIAKYTQYVLCIKFKSKKTCQQKILMIKDDHALCYSFIHSKV